MIEKEKGNFFREGHYLGKGEDQRGVSTNVHSTTYY